MRNIDQIVLVSFHFIHSFFNRSSCMKKSQETVKDQLPMVQDDHHRLPKLHQTQGNRLLKIYYYHAPNHLSFFIDHLYS